MNPTVKELLNRNVAFVEVGWTVLQVVALLKERQIGSVLVQKNDELVGIFTERDLMTRVDLTRPTALQATTIADVMSPSVVCIDCSTGVMEAMKMMRKHQIRHLPVKEAGQVVGIVSSRDLMEHYHDHLERLVLEQGLASGAGSGRVGKMP